MVLLPDPGRLVRDVLLVEGRGAGSILAGERILVALGGGGGVVWRRRSQVQEEGFGIGRGTPDEIRRLAGENVGEVVLGTVSVGNDLSVLVELVVVVFRIPFACISPGARILLSSGAYIHPGVPLIPAGRDVGRVIAGVAVQVLAEQSGPVALFLQANGDGGLLAPLVPELLEAPVWGLVARYAVVVGVEAGEDGRPLGTTQRVADEGVLE